MEEVNLVPTINLQLGTIMIQFICVLCMRIYHLYPYHYEKNSSSSKANVTQLW